MTSRSLLSLRNPLFHKSRSPNPPPSLKKRSLLSLPAKTPTTAKNLPTNLKIKYKITSVSTTSGPLLSAFWATWTLARPLCSTVSATPTCKREKQVVSPNKSGLPSSPATAFCPKLRNSMRFILSQWMCPVCLLLILRVMRAFPI